MKMKYYPTGWRMLLHAPVVASLALALPAAAQVGEQRHDFAIGVSGGIVMDKVGFTPKVNQTYHLGPTLGLALRYTSERYYGMYCAFQAEANYALLGWTENVYSLRNEPLPDTYRRDLSYLQVPILANLGFGKIDRGLKGYFIAGPQVSYLIGDAEHRSEVWTMAGNVPDRMNNVTAQYGAAADNKFEYGITAGVGIELSTGIGHFLVEGRYYMGLSNIYGNSKTDPFAKSNHSCITARITYLIDLTH